MKPRTKFLIGGVLVLGTAGYLAASDGTFRATTLLAKCASRYENAPDKPDKYKETPGHKRVEQRA